MSSDTEGKAARESSEQEVREATLLGFNISKRSLAWTIGASLVSAVALGVAMTSSDPETPSPSAGNGVVIQGNDNSNNHISYIGTVERFEQVARDHATEEELRQAAAEFGSTSPVGPGPWPFVVVADSDLGLKVRSSGLSSGIQVGSAATRAPLWTVCYSITDFNPQPGDPNGSKWIKIHWPNSSPGSRFMNSSPGDTKYGWVYGGLVVPVGSNGDIPQC